MSGARGKVETIGDQSKNNKYCIYIYLLYECCMMKIELNILVKIELKPPGSSPS